METFYEFCKEKSITIFESVKMPFKVNIKKDAKPRGFFCYDLNKNPIIWIKSDRNQNEILHTAAHELSHYLLSDLQAKEIQNKLVFLRNENVPDSDILMEMETDLMASFLLTKKRGKKQ